MTDFNMPQIAQRFFGEPLMIEPRKAEVMVKAFSSRIVAEAPVTVQGGIGDTEAGFPQKARAGSILHEGLSDHLTATREGYIKHQGVAVIEVMGSLVRRGSWVGQSSGQTSYEGLRAQIKAAAADPQIKAIALEFDSPGGEAAGAFELADLVREVRETKPVYGFCAEYAYSAAYALASQCDVLTVPEFGGAGSIGVIMMHIDQSKHLEQEGLTVTIIRSGTHKAEGNSAEPLPADLLADWTAEADKMRVKFADLVARGRGDRLSMADAMATEAKAFNGPEAVRLGLADRVADPKQAFDAMVASVNGTGQWDGTITAPAASATLSSGGCVTGAGAPHEKKEATDMADKKTQPDAIEQTGKVTEAATAEEVTQPTAKEAPDASAKADAKAITAMVARAGLPASLAVKMIDENLTYAQASDRVIDEVAKSNAAKDGGDIHNQASGIQVHADGTDKMRQGMAKAIAARAGQKGGERNEFTSMSLTEMARATLESRGLRVGSMSKTELVGAAFVPSLAGGAHTTSDFGSILADVANKSMLTAYEEAEETFEQFTKRGSLTDFKPSKRVGAGLFPGLDEVKEDAEFNYGSMGDFDETIVLATYGKLFKISRQAVINDDLGAFTTVPAKMGRAAKRTVGSLVYAVLNGNPNMSDGTALFHADHANLAGSGAAPSEATIDAGLTAMSKQKPRGTEDPKATLNIQPRFLLAPYSLRSAVLAALMSEKTPDSANNKSSQRYNTVYRAAEPIFDSRITGSKWFLAADPMQFDTIEVAYLDGVSEPFIEQQDGWSVDGTEMKVRLDAGVAPMAWEGLYKDPGA